MKVKETRKEAVKKLAEIILETEEQSLNNSFNVEKEMFICHSGLMGIFLMIKMRIIG